MQVLRLNEAEQQHFDTIPEPYRKYLCVYSYEGDFYWLHEELLAPDKVSAPLCNRCHNSVFKQLGDPSRPQHSVAAGKHFGRLCDLPKPTWCEHQMLALVRTTMNVVKLVAAGGADSTRFAIRGHSISIPHEGPQKVAKCFPNVDALLGTKIIFVGWDTTWDDIKTDPTKRAKVEKIFTVNWAALVKWLRVLKVVNPLYAHIEILQELPLSFTKHQENILDVISLANSPDVVTSEKWQGQM